MVLFPLILVAFAAVTANAEVLYLKNGTQLEGSVIGGDSREIVVETSMGTIQVPRYNIERIVYAEAPVPETLKEQAPELVEETHAEPVEEEQVSLPEETEVEEPVPAEETAEAEEEEPEEGLYGTTLQLMVLKKSFLHPDNRTAMQEMAQTVPLEERLNLYAAGERNDKAMAAGLNFLVPSLGSWIQGDVGGALAQDVFLSAGLLLVVNPYDWKAGDDDLAYTGIGVGLLAFQYLYGLIRPAAYVASYNDKLADSLALEDGILNRYRRGPNQDLDTAVKASDDSIGVELVKVKY
jgi:hypothetical protein